MKKKSFIMTTLPLVMIVCFQICYINVVKSQQVTLNADNIVPSQTNTIENSMSFGPNNSNSGLGATVVGYGNTITNITSNYASIFGTLNSITGKRSIALGNKV